MIQIAVMGYGTIGSGVVEVIEKNAGIIRAHVGDEVRVKYVLDLRDFPGDPIESRIVHDYQVIANDPEIVVVVETMGGVEPAYTFVKEMLLHGKSVSTSNKNLVAEKGAELIAIAKERDLNFQFEASVGGGIPIIRSIYKSLTADVIEEISGILNGTTNYMLTKMTEEGSDYETVLKEAQELGYAERDPSADVEGYDACRKIAILTSLISGKQVDFRKIYTEGITKITPEDIRYALAMKKRIRLIASSTRTGDTYTALVAPFLVGEEHPLYTVNGVFNAVFVHGNMLGDAMFYGSGAGKLPTASAVVADVVDIAKHYQPNRNIPIQWSSEELQLQDIKAFSCRFFVRIRGGGEEAKAAFGQIETVSAGISGETAFLTGEMTESAFEEKAKGVSIISRIRIK